MLLCLGLSHRTAPIALRERLHYSADTLKDTLNRRVGWQELVLLSTCNRLELYAVARTEDSDSLIALIEDTSGVPRPDFDSHLYYYSGADTVPHLFRVAAGLDSLILGEPQILGQVTHAYETARKQSTTGPILSALFRSAIRTGKRARTETAISRDPASISSAAAKLAQNVVPNLGTAQVLIIGAGGMTELAMEALRSRGVKRISVISRTLERAEQLAARWGGQALTFDNLLETLVGADIVVSSTSAPHFIITPDTARGDESPPASPVGLH